MSDSMGKAGAEETAKKSEEKKRVLNRFFQRKRYKDAYRAARTGKAASSAGGAATVAGVENITVKAKIALKEMCIRDRSMDPQDGEIEKISNPSWIRSLKTMSSSQKRNV